MRLGDGVGVRSSGVAVGEGVAMVVGGGDAGDEEGGFEPGVAETVMASF